MKIIQTHKAPHHADELYAIAALVLAEGWFGIKVVCSDEDQEADAHVDVGGVFDPETRQFDHHQMVDSDEAAISLVVQSYPCLQQLYEHDTSFRALVDRVRCQDTRGAAAAKNRMFSTGTLDDYFGMLAGEHVMLDVFAIAPELAIEHIVRWLRGKLELVQEKAQLLEHLRTHAQCQGDGDILVVPFWPEGATMQASNHAMRDYGTFKVVVSPNLSERNPLGVWTVFRTATGKADLYRIFKDDPHFSYVDSRGFLAVARDGVEPTLEHILRELTI